MRNFNERGQRAITVVISGTTSAVWGTEHTKPAMVAAGSWRPSWSRTAARIAILSYQLTIAELMGIAVVFDTPYLIVGLIWVVHSHRAPTPDAGRRPGRVFPGLNRVLACPAVFQRLHDLRHVQSQTA